MRSIKLDLRPSIRKMEFFTKKVVNSDYTGEYASAQKRKGIEFEDYKKFNPGDDATLIDWKASLRSGKLLVRQYTQTKNLDILILLDVSNSMLFSSTGKIKCEYAAELAAALGYYFLNSDNSVGMALFNEKVVKYVPQSLGSNQFSLITRVLSDPSMYGGDFNFSKTMHNVHDFLREGSVVIIISDFIGMESNWQKSVGIISRKADVSSIIIRDPHDLSVKDKVGQALISDPFSNRVMLVDFENIRKSYEENAREKLDDVRDKLKKYGVDSLLLKTNTSFVDPVVKFFAGRRIRWR